MQTLEIHRDSIGIVGAFVLPLGVAGVLVPFRDTFADTASALVLVAVVAAVAIIGPRTAGLIAAASASLWFDFFLTRPYERFAITHREDIETAVTLFVVGVVITEMAARGRHHRQVASEESDYVEVVYGVGELMASTGDVDEVIDRVNSELIGLLHLRECRFEAGALGPPMTQIEPDGHVVLGGHRWAVHRMGLPGSVVQLPVQARGEPVGRFVVHPTPGAPVSLRRRRVAVALADQVGAYLTPRLRPA